MFFDDDFNECVVVPLIGFVEPDERIATCV